MQFILHATIVRLKYLLEYFRKNLRPLEMTVYEILRAWEYLRANLSVLKPITNAFWIIYQLMEM